MEATALDRRGLPGRLIAAPGAVPAAVAALFVVAIAVRLRGLGAALWLDEAQAVDIARHPLGDLPHLLRLDGSPPLYYALLHVWMRVVGDNVTRIHLLSAGCAALCVPAGFLAGREVGGTRAGLFAAALLAVNPLLTTYTVQARMYTLLALEGLLVLAALTAVFAHRRRRWLAPLAIGLAAMLYTHNWGFFLAAGALAAVAVAVRGAAERRARLLDAAIAFGGAAVLYAPWVPRLLDQVRHTGAPWSVHPTTLTIVRGLSAAVGGDGAASLLLVLGGAGVVIALRSRELEARRALAVALVAVGAGLVVALAYTEVSLAWAPRYLALFAGPLTVLGAAGWSRMAGVGVAALALAVAMTIGQPHTRILENKTNVFLLAHAMRHRLHPGDLVVSTQPEQVPDLHYYLPRGLRYADPHGLVADPGIMNWRDALARLRRTRVSTGLEPLLDRLPVGGRLLLVNPSTTPQGLASRWARAVRRRKVAWLAALHRDRRFVRLARFARDPDAAFAGATATLYLKRRSTG